MSRLLAYATCSTSELAQSVVIISDVPRALSWSIALLLRPQPSCIRLGMWKSRVDRKSTRLNSSHSQISYAVFCLKKKKKINARRNHHTILPSISSTHVRSTQPIHVTCATHPPSTPLRYKRVATDQLPEPRHTPAV